MLVGLEVPRARQRVDGRSAASEAARLLIFLAPKQWRIFAGYLRDTDTRRSDRDG
jgi:hypothetical protein